MTTIFKKHRGRRWPRIKHPSKVHRTQTMPRAGVWGVPFSAPPQTCWDPQGTSERPGICPRAEEGGGRDPRCQLSWSEAAPRSHVGQDCKSAGLTPGAPGAGNSSARLCHQKGLKDKGQDKTEYRGAGLGRPQGSDRKSVV